jgi:23S rRNA (uracil1939-C5)-methyltransferase
VDVTHDVLASERVDELREDVKRWCREEGLSGYDRSDHTGLLRNLVVREGRRTGQIQARLVTSPGDLRAQELAGAIRADGVLWTRAAGVGETTRGGDTELLTGDGAIEEEVEAGGRRLLFRISPEAFFQTNTEMAERLYGVVVDMAGLSGSERVFDLYCGIGTISLALAPRAGEVWGLEVSKHAVADAITNAERNEIDNARFFAGDVRWWSTRRGPACRARSCAASSKPMRRASSTSRATRRRWPRTRASSSKPATGSSPCYRWTCSPRRRTSSASRCCRA